MSEGVTGQYAATLETHLLEIMYGRGHCERVLVVNKRQRKA